MRAVKFKKKFANKKKGDELFCTNILASHLVHRDKVADYKDKEEKQEKA